MSISKSNVSTPSDDLRELRKTTEQSFIERVSAGEEIDPWLLAGEIASPNFYWEGGYYSKERYRLVDDGDSKRPVLRPGVPHGMPQADTITAEEAEQLQRKVYGHLRHLAERASRTPRPKD